MKLVLADINAEKLQATVAEFEAQGVEVIGQRVDVADSTQMDAFADAAFARFGNVHLLVNNAGVAISRPVWETTLEDWQWVMGVNFYGVTNGLRAFIPRMLANGDEGHIVNTASVAGLLSQPSTAAYNASKHAVVTVSEGLYFDLQLRQAKLKVSVLCPAWVKTGIADAERNRTIGEYIDFSKADAVNQFTAGMMHKAVAKGISVDKVADDVFNAIATEQFYILTHPNIKPLIQTRMEDILQQRNPTLAGL
jgi:NAD(P)-dependent dehydrogenase (short-subunit alcohol dehydrogenase family)